MFVFVFLVIAKVVIARNMDLTGAELNSSTSGKRQAYIQNKKLPTYEDIIQESKT